MDTDSSGDYMNTDGSGTGSGNGSSNGMDVDGEDRLPSPVSDVAGPVWPQDWTYCDVVYGFHECDRAARAAKARIAGSVTVQERFKQIFPGIKWVRSSYYKHVARWSNAPSSVGDKYRNLGHAEKARYSNFLAEVPNPRAKLENAKKRIKRQQSRQLSVKSEEQESDENDEDEE
ncbi:hypothetical protein PsYK624_146070 [Phanerochaete sordida]|uniref:Uncharacterized protein n=1 Tax=Phanerochaete sordida TaxID=48140 RepID=A0A9P3GNV9_9APHY|nr:hypothetical protein PsYK624_146070 [Phanerochaete sordida]